MKVIKKLTKYYIDLFLIKKKIDHIAYRLDIPPVEKIYTVCSIVLLE